MAGYNDYQTEEEYAAAARARDAKPDWEALAREGVTFGKSLREYWDGGVVETCDEDQIARDSLAIDVALDAFLDRARKAGVE